MARGQNVLAILFIFGIAVSMLSGIGFYASAGLNPTSGVSDDVEKVNESVGGAQDAQGGGGEGFLGFTSSTVKSLTAGWMLITSTSEALQVFFGLPEAIADGLELFARFTFGMFILMIIRGLVWD